MTTVQADRTVCIGSGNCVLTAADTFDQDDQEGLVLLIGTDDPADADQQTLIVDDEHAEGVRQAVAMCPSSALRLLSGDDAG